MSRLSKKPKAEWSFFWNEETADGHTTSYVENAETNVSRVSEQRLFIARNTTLKEVLNQHLKATNSTIRVKTENYTRAIFESHVELPETAFCEHYRAGTRKGVSVEYLPKPLSA